MNVAETRQAGDDCKAGGAADPSILMGRCTGCSQAFRAEIPSGRPVFAGYATDAARAAGYPCRHGCRAVLPAIRNCGRGGLLPVPQVCPCTLTGPRREPLVDR